MPSRGSSTESLGAEIQNMATQLYEVKYIGKISVSTSKTERDFIDEAVLKFDQHEKRKRTLRKSPHVTSFSSSTEGAQRAARKSSGGGAEPMNTSSESDASFASSSSGAAHTDGDVSDLSGCSGTDVSFEQRATRFRPNNSSSYESMEEEESSSGASPAAAADGSPSDAAGAQLFSSAEKNRTMLIGVGKATVTLISPDRKSVILERDFSDISYCAQVRSFSLVQTRRLWLRDEQTLVLEKNRNTSVALFLHFLFGGGWGGWCTTKFV